MSNFDSSSAMSADQDEEYWRAYHDYAVQNGGPHRSQANPVRTANYYPRRSKERWWGFSAFTSKSINRVGVYFALWRRPGMPDVRQVFSDLQNNREAIEAQVGETLLWTKDIASSRYY